MKLTTFSAAYADLFYEWYESGHYPIFFRGLDGFYSRDLFQQLPALMQSHLYVILKDKEAIGCVNIHDWNRTARVCSLGVMIAKNIQGNGYCPEAINLAVKYLLDERNVQKINFEFSKDDPKLIHLAEKLGLKKEGEFEREAFVGGKYLTMVRFAFFAEQYAECINKWRGNE